MRNAVVLGGLLAWMAAARAGTPAEDAEAMMAQGEGFFAKGNYAAALAMFNAAHTLVPDRPGPFLWIGLTFAAQNDCKQAVPALEGYLKLKGSDPKPEALRALAACRPSMAPAAQGRVRVASNPSGAFVRIDDPNSPPVGSTPFQSSSLAPGLHTVLLALDGYSPASEEVTVEPGVISSVKINLVSLSAPPPQQPPQPAPARHEPQPPPPLIPVTPAAPPVGVPPSADEVGVCPATAERSWQFCDARGRGIPEMVFIERYTRLTGSHELDASNTQWSKVKAGYAAVATLSTVFGVAFLGTSWIFDKDIGPIGVYVLLVDAVIACIGFPIMTRQAHSTTIHGLDENQARRYAELYNQALRTRGTHALAVEPRVRFTGLGIAF